MRGDFIQVWKGNCLVNSNVLQVKRFLFTRKRTIAQFQQTTEISLVKILGKNDRNSQMLMLNSSETKVKGCLPGLGRDSLCNSRFCFRLAKRETCEDEQNIAACVRGLDLPTPVCHSALTRLLSFARLGKRKQKPLTSTGA